MNRSQLLVSFGLLCVVGIVGIGGVTGSPAAPQQDGSLAGPEAPVLASDHVNECAATPPADLSAPEGGTAETIGYVDGYWYNETVDIEDNPLDQEQLRNLTRRTAARVEALRCFTFKEVPPLEMVTRDEYRSDVEQFFAEEYNESDERFASAQLATMLVAGQAENATDLLIENQVAFPAAFYDIEEKYMGFVTDDPDNISIDQTTLAHELTHALTAQYFNLSATFEEPTNDDFISSLTVVEGDANLVEKLYEENCGNESGWGTQRCLEYSPDPGDPPSWGLTLNQLTAYHTPLVADTYEEQGLDGVNQLYENMPTSTIESIYPNRYGEFERANVTIPDESTDSWHRLDVGDPSYDILGQHALTGILMAPYYESQGMTQVINANSFFRGHRGGSVHFGHPSTNGWEGDKFYGYTNDEANGAVWKFEWERDGDARQFVGAYEELIEYRGGQQTDEYANVYTFELVDEYDMALGIEQTDDDLLIVMAPTVDDLQSVHESFEFEAADTDETDNGDDGTDDESNSDDGDGMDDDDMDGNQSDGSAGDGDSETDENGNQSGTDDADDDGTGFGLIAGMVALLASGGLLRLRQTTN